MITLFIFGSNISQYCTQGNLIDFLCILCQVFVGFCFSLLLSNSVLSFSIVGLTSWSEAEWIAYAKLYIIITYNAINLAAENLAMIVA